MLLSAHYDSRGTFGSTTAPGGDDDGSGTAALLAIARTLGSANITFSPPFNSLRSREKNKVSSDPNTTLPPLHRSDLSKASLADGYASIPQARGTTPTRFPDKLATSTATNHIWNLAEIYTPELEQGYTPACCSDHQSFWEQNFPATWVFERNGPIADPMYHKSGDTTSREGYSVEQLASIARVVLASVLDVAGFEL